MFIPDPDLSILDPGSNNSRVPIEEEGKMIFGPTIFCSHKYQKIVNDFIFEQVKKFFFSQSTKNYSTFYPKICH